MICCCLLSRRQNPFEKDSSLKGKNLLIEEQILFFKS